MPRIRAFDGYLVAPARAAEVVSPAYDAVSPQKRRAFAEAHPQNYLNTMRLREDFPADAQPSADELLALNKKKLDELIAGGAFDKLSSPCMFIYRLSVGGHTQTGVVCEVPVDEYARGQLRKHENTRADKEDLLVMYQRVVGVSSSPICLAYPHHDGVEKLINAHTAPPPALDFTAADGVAQQVWCIEDATVQEKLSAAFAEIETTYLTDGHHRAASGWRCAQAMRARHDDDDDAPYNRLLVALFSTEQLALLPFHRAVKDLNGLSEAQLVGALKKKFEVESSPSPVMPSRHGEFGMLVGGNWHRLRIRDADDAGDPVASLDVSRLQNHILAPILGVADARNDPRLDYVSGVSGVGGLRQKIADGWAVCFATFATSIKQLMAVADAGALMPPKSTYFNPKANSGVFIRCK